LVIYPVNHLTSTLGRDIALVWWNLLFWELLVTKVLVIEITETDLHVCLSVSHSAEYLARVCNYETSYSENRWNGSTCWQ